MEPTQYLCLRVCSEVYPKVPFIKYDPNNTLHLNIVCIDDARTLHFLCISLCSVDVLYLRNVMFMVQSLNIVF